MKLHFLRTLLQKFLQKTGLSGESEVYYIGSGTSLPEPLTKEEEAAELLRLEYPETRRAAQQTLIERNLRLVVYIARKFENTGISMEDLISIGTIGLIKAINTFKTDKKIKLAPYASRCIENEILMYLRKNSGTRVEVSFDEPLNVDWDGNELLLSDILGTEDDITQRRLDDEVDKQLLYQAMERLSCRERRIMELRFGMNRENRERTQKEVADMMGISQSYISRLEKRIILRLKRDITKMMNG